MLGSGNMQTIEFEEKSYTVSFEAMPQALKEQLSEQDLQRYLELLQLVQMRPREVYKEVKEFAERLSNVPEVINLLTFAHIQNHRIVEAEKLIEDTFTKYPEYLFARINYADQCVRKKKLDKIPEIFPTFDLQKLCPEKEVYHTSEFRGFLIMMAHYCRAKKEQEKAIHYYEAAKNVEPDHPSIIYLGKKLFKKSLLRRLLGLK